MNGNIVTIIVVIIIIIIVVKVIIIKANLTNLPRRLDGDRSVAAVLAQQVGSAEPKRDFDI